MSKRRLPQQFQHMFCRHQPEIQLPGRSGWRYHAGSRLVAAQHRAVPATGRRSGRMRLGLLSWSSSPPVPQQRYRQYREWSEFIEAYEQPEPDRCPALASLALLRDLHAVAFDLTAVGFFFAAFASSLAWASASTSMRIWPGSMPTQIASSSRRSGGSLLPL